MLKRLRILLYNLLNGYIESLRSIAGVLTFSGVISGSGYFCIFEPFQNDILTKSFMCSVIACPILSLMLSPLSGFFWITLSIVFIMTSLLLFFIRKLKIPEFILSV